MSDVGALIALVSAVIALGAMGVSIFNADFARRQAIAAEDQAVIARGQMQIAEDQATSAREQAEAAKQQADTAREQAAAAWDQVEEARRANEIAEAERAARRAVGAVRWTATVDGNVTRIAVRNVGTETAYNVQISRYGEDNDWLHGAPEEYFEEIRAGDYAPFRLRGSGWPEQIYVLWDGAPHPRAVEVEVDS